MSSLATRLCRGLAAVVLGASAAVAQTSSNVTLLSQQNIHSTYSSCWGWTSPGGQELAILGAGTGTSIVDVTVPTAPSEKAYIAGVSSQWREMKTYQHYAYIVTEGSGGGMQIVDLATTPPSLVRTYTTTFDHAHSITIAGSYAYVNGARLGATQVGLRILSLADPVNPVDVGGWTQYYTHDCKVRGDTLWAACINNDLIAVVNIVNRAAPSTITTFTWPGNVSHNCDLTTDGKYLLTTDETPGGHLHVFDVGNLANIQLVAEWTANPAGIIHNVHVRGSLAYIAYYTEGMRVVDISDPAYPVELGWYDTWPGTSGGYNGNWEAYPYAASGNAYLSDITSGLFVVRFEQTTGSVSGRVRETGSGTLLPGAHVQLVGGPETVANASAFFKLFDLPGPHPLVTASFGYQTDSTVVTLVLGVNTPHDVQLTPSPGAPVQGTVRNAASAAPLAGASLVLQGTPLVQAGDAAGLYTFANVPYGVYTLAASAFGFAPQQKSLLVSLHDLSAPQTLDFDLQPATLAADFEAGPGGWARVAPPNQATSGLWEWVDPIGSGGGVVQPEDDHSPNPGHLCWVTGNAASAADPVGTADVDNGATILMSPVFDLSGLAHPTLSYWRWYSDEAGSNPESDTLHVEISNNGGTTWKVVERRVPTQPQWTHVTVPVASLLAPTATMRVRFIAEDIGLGSVVEAAIDDFSAYDAPVTAVAPPGAPVNALYPNVPNPFNPSTHLRFELAAAGPATLRIFDPRGRLVRSLVAGPLAAGPHESAWDGRDARGRAVASGVYLARLEAAQFTASRRLLLLK